MSETPQPHTHEQHPYLQRHPDAVVDKNKAEFMAHAADADMTTAAKHRKLARFMLETKVDPRYALEPNGDLKSHGKALEQRTRELLDEAEPKQSIFRRSKTETSEEKREELATARAVFNRLDDDGRKDWMLNDVGYMTNSAYEGEVQSLEHSVKANQESAMKKAEKAGEVYDDVQSRTAA